MGTVFCSFLGPLLAFQSAGDFCSDSESRAKKSIILYAYLKFW